MILNDPCDDRGIDEMEWWLILAQIPCFDARSANFGKTVLKRQDTTMLVIGSPFRLSSTADTLMLLPVWSLIIYLHCAYCFEGKTENALTIPLPRFTTF
jgi:hypothetical protein